MGTGVQCITFIFHIRNYTEEHRSFKKPFIIPLLSCIFLKICKAWKKSQAFHLKNSSGLQSPFSTCLEQPHFGEDFSTWTYDKWCKNPLLTPPLLCTNKAGSLWWPPSVWELAAAGAEYRMEGRQSRRGTTRRLSKRGKYLVDLAPSSSSHSDVGSSQTQCRWQVPLQGLEGLDRVLSSMFQFFVAHLFPLFSLTVHSNNILIKAISI